MIISVIIPTFKPHNYLFQCLDSLCAQTLSKNNYEIIIILNGCNEPYYTIISRYISNHTDMAIVLKQTDISGVSNARNIGLSLSKGEYVAFIDDDDIISETYLEHLLEISTPNCIGCSNSYSFEDNPREKKSNFITHAFVCCSRKKYSLFKYRKFLSAPWGKMIHKSIIQANRFPVHLKKSEDSIFCLLLTPFFINMKLSSPDAIYFQRSREGSAMHTKQDKMELLKEHLLIEWEYLKIWLSNPFKFNALFVMSRMVACGKNLYEYLHRP